MNSYYILDKKYRFEKDYGSYICTCGDCYQIENCSNPWVYSNCKNCNRKIGGQSHILAGPEMNQTNHFRVIFDKNYNKVDEKVRCKLFEDYKREELINI